MTMIDTDELREQFHAVTAQVSAIREKADPLRAARDLDLQAAEAIFRERTEEIKAIEAPLFDLEKERGDLASRLKALGEETGPLREEAAYLANS